MSKKILEVQTVAHVRVILRPDLGKLFRGT